MADASAAMAGARAAQAATAAGDAGRRSAAAAEPSAGAVDSGVIVDGAFPSPAIKEAFEAALGRVAPLPAGVTLTVSNSPMWGDNPQIRISVDGRQVYWEYLYHSEANLARLRRTWTNPGTWVIPSEPSKDLSKRFEAALRLAHAGAAKVRSAKKG